MREMAHRIENGLNAFLEMPDWIVAMGLVAFMLLAVVGSCLASAVL